MDRYNELKKEMEELKEYVLKLKRNIEDEIHNLDEDNFTDDFKMRIIK